MFFLCIVPFLSRKSIVGGVTTTQGIGAVVAEGVFEIRRNDPLFFLQFFVLIFNRQINLTAKIWDGERLRGKKLERNRIGFKPAIFPQISEGRKPWRTDQSHTPWDTSWFTVMFQAWSGMVGTHTSCQNFTEWLKLKNV